MTENKKANIWKCRDVEFNLDDKPLIMGILNVTPDSFSDGGKFSSLDSAIAQAEKMKLDGADIIDIGGESSRPFSEPVSEEEELRRVMPVIESLVKSINTPISIDTYKSSVAKAALEAGVKIVNDISGCASDKMADIVKEFDAGIVVMHMKGSPKDMQTNPQYGDVVEELINFFFDKKRYLKEKNILDNQIVIDPGFGFGKRYEDNLELLNRLDEFEVIGFPILAGTSRKSFIKKAVGYTDEEKERIEGTVATNMIGLVKGARIFRVHDVGFHKKALEMAWAILKS